MTKKPKTRKIGEDNVIKLGNVTHNAPGPERKAQITRDELLSLFARDLQPPSSHDRSRFPAKRRDRSEE